MVVDAESSQAEVDLVFQALADATRRDILQRVLEREQSVSSLARAYPISLPAVQKHVAVLERAGLVGRVRHGREQRVGPRPEGMRVARALLDRFEALQRHRVATMDALLEEDADDEEEG